jgi:predicted branched-subunit amino acid permease
MPKTDGSIKLQNGLMGCRYIQEPLMTEENTTLNSNHVQLDLIKAECLRGMKVMTPFLLSAIPQAMIGGAYGISSGLSHMETLSLAMIVNSGMVQFVGIKLFQEGVGYGIILLTSLILSMRLIFYSTVLRPYMRKLSPRWRIILGFGLIDVVYFIVIDRLKKSKTEFPGWQWYYLSSSALMYVSWMSATVFGMLIGSSLPDFMSYGFDFPVTAYFAAILASTLINWKICVTVVIAAVLILATHTLPYGMGLIVATLGGTISGYLCEQLEKYHKTLLKDSMT